MGRRKQKPTPADQSVHIAAAERREAIEAQADQFLLNADREMLLAISQNVQALREGMESLKLPSNDPEYLKRLQASDAARSAIANKLTQVDIVPDGQKSYIGVGSFTHHEALDVARRLSEHFELKIRQHE